MGSGTSSSFRIIAAGASWRLFGSAAAAETLLDAVSGDDEQNRMLAGISLVKAGQRSFELIRKKIDAGEATPAVIRLLPDIAGEKARPMLEQVAAGGDGEKSAAATECVELLDRIKKLQGRIGDRYGDGS